MLLHEEKLAHKEISRGLRGTGAGGGAGGGDKMCNNEDDRRGNDNKSSKASTAFVVTLASLATQLGYYLLLTLFLLLCGENANYLHICILRFVYHSNFNLQILL